MTVAKAGLLVALAVGAFLVGVELMVTAVALPQIVADLSDWTDLRRASWIVNAYLVAYIAVMPLAGRAVDRYDLGRLYLLSLLAFAAGSLTAGAAQTLDQLIAARIVQGLGAGAIVPIATAGASYIFEGAARARAIGLIGAVTFLGTAAGPFVGAAILGALDRATPLAAPFLEPAWRWVFYLAAPVALLAALYTWAAGIDVDRPRGRSSLDVVGATLFTIAITSALLAVTTLDSGTAGASGMFVIVAGTALCLALLWLSRTRDPFIELRHFTDRTFSGAVVVSVLTGYALATALIGGAVFVDRVMYAGPSEQQVALGALAGATAVGALVSGFLVRPLGIVMPALVGAALAAGSLFALSGVSPETPMSTLALSLTGFGFGFGLTVTARSTAAVEAVGPGAYGAAAASVTVARMLGMSAGLAILTVFGSNRIEALSTVLVDPAARDAVLPSELVGRPLEDYLVVDALERWAAGQAATILGDLFLVAAAITAVAILPTLAMRNRPRAGADDRRTIGVEEGSSAGYGI